MVERKVGRIENKEENKEENKDKKQMTESEYYVLVLKELDNRLENFMSYFPWIIFISGVLSVIL